MRIKFLLFIVILSILLATVAYARVLTPQVVYGIPNSTVGQRLIYFNQDNAGLGTGYTWPLGTYGRKGATSGGAYGDFGFKGATSVSSNLAWNAFIRRGRDPTHISNNDPRMRGYSIKDVVVELEPVDTEWVFQNNLITRSKGTARIISDYDDVKGYDPARTRVYLRVRDLPPLDNENIYQVWLVDLDTGYPLSIGMINPPMVGIAELSFDAPMSAFVYDTLVITVEPFPDTDLHPGKPVMAGDIPQTRIMARDVSNLPFRSQWLD
ncbi:anti-sigma factor [Candidatus Woesearchaeota archaeon]|nr:anti-sigma factor [Candidatus Woesearchaeota archaeon]